MECGGGAVAGGDGSRGVVGEFREVGLVPGGKGGRGGALVSGEFWGVFGCGTRSRGDGEEEEGGREREEGDGRVPFFG